jgi:hypothetical protein
MMFAGLPPYRRSIAFSALICLGLLVTSCTDNKVSQCNKLIKVANGAVSSVESVTQNASPNNSPDNVEAMTKIAEAADKAKADMQGLQLSDEKLKDFQTRFVSMYTDTSKATRDLVKAAGSKDAASAQKAFDSLKSATDREAPLVSEVNKYCTTN